MWHWLWRCALAFVALFVAGMITLTAFGLCDYLDEPDVALVLGNAVERNHQPAPLLQARLDETLVLWRQGYFRWIITSGAVEDPGRDEAVIMRDYLVAHGVPAECILVDSAGINTYASARYTVRTMREHGWDEVCVVTQAFHIPRAELALERFGANKVSHAHARSWDLKDIFHTMRETVAYPYYYFRHYDRVSSKQWHRDHPKPPAEKQ